MFTVFISLLNLAFNFWATKSKLINLGRHFLLCISFVFGFISHSHANEACSSIILLKNSDNVINLGRQILVQDVSNKSTDLEKSYSLHCDGYIPIKNLDNWVTIKATFKNETKDTSNWVLDLNSVTIGEAELIEEKTQRRQYLDWNSRKPIFTLNILPGEKKTYILKIEETVAPNLLLYLKSEKTHLKQDIGYLVGLAISLGFMSAILMLNLFLVFYTKRRAFQYYSAYLASMICAILIYDGFLQRLDLIFWEHETTELLISFFNTTAICFLLFFTRDLLLLKQKMPRSSSLLLGLIVMALLSIMIWPLASEISILLQDGVILFAIIIMFTLSIYRHKQGYRPAKAYMLSFCILFIGLGLNYYIYYAPSVLFAFSNSAIEIYMFIQDWGFHGTIICEASIVSLALRTYDKGLGATSHLDSNILPTLEVKVLKPANERFIIQAHDVVQKHMSDPSFNVEVMASELATSPRTLRRKIQNIKNITPVEFIRIERLRHAQNLLKKNTFKTISEVAYSVGFSSPSNFSKYYKDLFGKSPNEENP